MNDQSIRDLTKLLNPAQLRKNLIAASLYLSAYEILKTSVVQRIRGFFCDGIANGQLTTSPEYKTSCLSLDKNEVIASGIWLKQIGAINEDDVERLVQIKKHRNDLAHELPKYLIEADSEINLELLSGIRDLIAKIDYWWIREVEMTTNPMFIGADASADEIRSGNELLVQAMIEVATNEDAQSDWEELQAFLAANAGSRSQQP